MGQISVKKRLPKYYRIYKQIFENPSMPLYQMTKSTGISRSTISRYAIEMYEFSILKGPLIFIKPAHNYHQYSAFCSFENPLPTYKSFSGFPHVVYRSLNAGDWNLLLISEKLMDFSLLKGFRQCIAQGKKSVTCLSKVTSLEWNRSMEKMHNAVSSPTGKSTLYEEIPLLPWKKEEWTLYHMFRHNMRIQTMPILKKCRIGFERYRKWATDLPKYTCTQPAFFPHGLKKYFVLDFLFKSQYHKQLADILGMLPSTTIFFSTDRCLFVRLALLNKNQQDDLFTLIYELEDRGYFTRFYYAMAISASEKEEQSWQ